MFRDNRQSGSSVVFPRVNNADVLRLGHCFMIRDTQ